MFSSYKLCNFLVAFGLCLRGMSSTEGPHTIHATTDFGPEPYRLVPNQQQSLSPEPKRERQQAPTEAKREALTYLYAKS